MTDALEISIEKIARVCHEANRAYCNTLGEEQPSWDMAPKWQKDSAIQGVRFHLMGEHTPEESHISWMTQKIKDGWVYGDVKDAEKKTHPCMKPYGELPERQQTKDYLFVNIVKAFKGELGISAQVAARIVSETALNDSAKPLKPVKRPKKT